MVLFVLVQIVYFGYSYGVLMTSPNYTTFRDVLGNGLAMARAAANVINLDSALLLFTVCRNFISVLRTTFLSKLIPVNPV